MTNDNETVAECYNCCYWGDSEFSTGQDRSKVQLCVKRAVNHANPPETPDSFSCPLYKEAGNRD